MAEKRNKTTESSLRIIAGSWKGRRIRFRQLQDSLRPTGDRIRETLFNWLSPQINNSRCMDLFAGTGSLGIEALSRGAAEVLFVEQDRSLARQLRDNLQSLQAVDASIHIGDALQLLKKRVGEWDIVFLDPPFESTDYNNLCKLVERSDCVKPGGYIYIEISSQAEWPELPHNWEISREATAGQVHYALIQRQAAGADK